jgi:hypothetical protein
VEIITYKKSNKQKFFTMFAKPINLKYENMKITVLSLFTLLITINSGVSQEMTKTNTSIPILKGTYLGQKPPGMNPEVFAPGIISNGLENRDVAISPDGNEMYFGIHTPNFKYSTIIVTKQIDGVWTKPEVVSFASDPRYLYLEPALSCDGKKLFFFSNMPKDSTDNPGDEDIWVVEKVNNEWGKPHNIGEPINTDGKEFYPSLAENGTIYFTRADKGQNIHYIYRSRLIDGKYDIPEKLPKQVNCGTNRFNAYVAPDESYIVVPATGIVGGLGGVDYYIVFRNEDDSWEEPINMGPNINSPNGAEWSFYVSPDKMYIFYMATKELPKEKQPKSLNMDFFLNFSSIPQNGNADIYWIDAKIIDKLRPKKK